MGLIVTGDSSRSASHQRREPARVHRRVRRRGRVVPVAVRPAAPPRLPLDRHRTRSRRAAGELARARAPHRHHDGVVRRRLRHRCSSRSACRRRGSVSCSAITRPRSRACRARSCSRWRCSCSVRCSCARRGCTRRSGFIRSSVASATPRPRSRAWPSASAGRRASDRSSARSSASPRISTACGRAERCWPSTRSGLGLPFLLSGLLLGRIGGALAWFKRHFAVIVGGSAVIIGLFGLLLMFDQLSRLSLHLQTWLTDAHLRWLVELG